MSRKRDSTNIGAVIRAYRKENRISLQKFAEMSGLSKSYVAMLETNQRPDNQKPPSPSLECVVAVAKVVGMSTVDLLVELGVDMNEDNEKKVAVQEQMSTHRSGAAIKPFEYIPLNNENLHKAAKTRSIILLPFPAPEKNGTVWVPVPAYGMAVAHTIDEVNGGVYTATAEVTGKITFSLFDINRTVFLDRGEATAALKKK